MIHCRISILWVAGNMVLLFGIALQPRLVTYSVKCNAMPCPRKIRHSIHYLSCKIINGIHGDRCFRMECKSILEIFGIETRLFATLLCVYFILAFRWYFFSARNCRRPYQIRDPFILLQFVSFCFSLSLLRSISLVAFFLWGFCFHSNFMGSFLCRTSYLQQKKYYIQTHSIVMRHKRAYNNARVRKWYFREM